MKALGFTITVTGLIVTAVLVINWNYHQEEKSREESKMDSTVADPGWPHQTEDLKDVVWNDPARLITFTDAYGRPCTLVVIGGYAPALSCGMAKPAAPYETETHAEPDYSITRPAL